MTLLFCANMLPSKIYLFKSHVVQLIGGCSKSIIRNHIKMRYVKHEKPEWRAGSDLPWHMVQGHCERASGGGFYGEIVGNKDQQIHYFNMGYTQFMPQGKGVTKGETVSYVVFYTAQPAVEVKLPASNPDKTIPSTGW